MDNTKTNNVPENQSDDFKLADLIRLVREYWGILLKGWWIILLFTGVVTSYLGYKVFQEHTTYKARLTFIVNDSKSSAMGSLLGSFGGLFGGGGSENQLEKIMEISRSRKIIAQALFDSVTYNGKSDLFANMLIETEEIDKEWLENPTLKGFKFKSSDVSNFTRLENNVLLRCYAYFVGGENIEPKFNISLNEDSGVLSMYIISRNEDLSIDLTNKLYDKISAYYIEKSIEQEKRSYRILAFKKDSLERALKRNDFAGADHEDKNKGLLFETLKIPTKQYKRKDLLLTTMYAEASKNAGIAEFALNSSTPFLSVIDGPIPPIRPTPPGRFRALALGLILGSFLGAIFVIGRNVVRKSLAEQGK
jgi:uncharacterized protein involved in exopolysaccharide biosynthesis